MSRVILHIDMNSYFASVEQQANPFLRGKPIGVCGDPETRTVITAASREAKTFGVKSGMALHEAKKLCPNILLIAGDPGKYSYITNIFLDIFHKYTDKVEIFSIDEAFLDVTDYADRFGGAEMIAKVIKSQLRREIGEWITCSIGIAPNKLMAKLGSNLKKPDGLVVINELDIPLILKSIELTDLCGIGEKMKVHLLNMGIDTVAKLGSYPLQELVNRFGVLGHTLHNMGRGQDFSEVVPSHVEVAAKSMGHSYTLPQNTFDLKVINRTLLRLSEKVGRRLRKDRADCRRVTAQLRFNNFSHKREQRTLNFATNDGYHIYKIASSIMNKWGSLQKPVRLVGVTASNLVHGVGQAKLFYDDQKQEQLTEAMDDINDAYGLYTVKRAALLDDEIIPPMNGFRGGLTIGKYS